VCDPEIVTQGSSRPFYTYEPPVTGCSTDADCDSSSRCVLNQCLTLSQLAEVPPFCGNARIDPGEACDEGVMNTDAPNAACRPNCQPGRCGDAILDTPLEQCDDGNTFANDGCSPSCLPERTAPFTGTLTAQVIELPFTENEDQEPTVIDGSITKDPGSVPSTPDTGPAALAIMIAGGAAGLLYRRKKS
jgi:cysteine-rich repeat protein